MSKNDENPASVVFKLEIIEADDDVLIVVNLSAATTLLVMLEEFVRAARRKKADRLFQKALENEVFRT